MLNKKSFFVSILAEYLDIDTEAGKMEKRKEGDGQYAQNAEVTSRLH